mmetsp:Transcript_17472/g.41028  ORF Transcript_17472/g.41028 Transcript_17472/m.41028 type:complete len:365 (-) Transcript_17472:108-1202(-)|eukprot:CAMPEP_0171142506 /NCGR_PEP_ID=MMETSP0766_2-20121228/142600_1 /TAXON_ID=439317 /ORGANISM="Gambierdiscus australes, Strain CAWD 149" /LENGTH=364 /DNA_ID=CAMNT_0011606295 /DNA_START=33 /DNA_END=1127 /DNA_ORIENTATION=-
MAADDQALTNALFELEDELFIVDNSLLHSTSNGIKYRRSPRLDDIDGRTGSVVKFGQTVEGISFPEGWVLVDGFGKKRFLPKTLQGLRVLVPVAEAWKQRESQLAEEESAVQPKEVSEHEARSCAGECLTLADGQLQANADAELLEVVGASIADHEALAGQLNRLRKILECGRANINVRGPGGCTPLMVAAKKGLLDSLVVLTRAGADTALRSPEGLTPAEIAAWKPAKALLHAMAGEESEARELSAALQKLKPHIRREAEDLVKSATTNQSQRKVSTVLTSPGSARARGMRYTVVQANVFAYEAPSLSAQELREFNKGDAVEVFGYDITRNWCHTQVSLPDGEIVTGWMLLQHDVLGELILPV